MSRFLRFFGTMIQRITLLAAFISLFTTLTTAQRPGGGGGGGRSGGGQEPRNGRFYGTLIDATSGKKVEYASVQLIGMAWDSVSKSKREKVLAGQLTGENGEFSLEQIPAFGNFTFKAACIGYENYESQVSFGIQRGERPDPAKLDKDLGNIKMQPSSVVLKETEIVGQAGGFSLALDKKVFKVDKNLAAAGGSAEDALRTVPSLSVDIDGNLTLRNSAPQIFVDGRPTNLTLDQIPADAIDNVELITNPSAKFDASGGSAGIVNIVLKKDRRIGYNGTLQAGVDMRGRPNLGASINARQGKINLFASTGLRMRRSLTHTETDRNNLFGFPTTNIFQDGNNTSDRQNINGRAGIDWFVNNRNTITLSGSLSKGGFRNSDVLDIQTDSLYSGRTGTGFSQRNTDGERQFSNSGAQLLYKKLFPKEGRELTADVNYNYSRSENNSEFNTTYSSAIPQTLQRQEGEGTNRFITIQSDYVTPLWNGVKWEAGVRAAIRSFGSENANYQYNYSDAVYERISNFADEYSYLDQVYAAYSTLSKSYKRWGYQLGLRAESSRYEGELPITQQSFGNEYPISLFPSVFTTYKLNEEDNIQLNYSRRVNRPNFFQLIPFPDFSDSLLLSRGNPNLKPEFTNSLEFSYQNILNRNHNFLVSVYYRYADNLITRYQFTEFNDYLDRETVVSSFANANQGYAYGGEITVKNTLAKIVELTTNLNLFNSVVNAANIESGLTNEQFSWNVKENMTIRLPKEYSLQISGEYESRTALAFSGGSDRGHGWREGPSSTAQGYRKPLGSVDISVRKAFFKRTLNATLSINDIFRTRVQSSYTANTAFIQETSRLRDPQFVRFNVSWRFGKFDTSLFRRKNNKSGEEEGEF